MIINDQVCFYFACQVLEYHPQPWNQWVEVADLEKETGAMLRCLSDESNNHSSRISGVTKVVLVWLFGYLSAWDEHCQKGYS